MIAAFSRYFPGLSGKELGKLFDRYRLAGRIDVQWNADAGQHDILFDFGALLTRKPVNGCAGAAMRFGLRLRIAGHAVPRRPTSSAPPASFPRQDRLDHRCKIPMTRFAKLRRSDITATT
jgi:hypothetical protein